jgi:stearoyl-CoA desaturase (delta-9 desaturase)
LSISTPGKSSSPVAARPVTEKPPVKWANTLLFSLTAFFAATLVPWYGFTYGFSLYDWIVFVLMMGFCGISITAGYHRLWSHKAYKAHPVLRVIFALGGACALQNDVFNWASDHRRHHQFVDNNDRDPYSAGRGLWYSHIGWMLRYHDGEKRDFSNIKDLQRDPILQWQHRHYLTLLLIMNIALPAFLGWLGGSIMAGLLLAGLLRLVLSQHFTWLINSLAHYWGKQTYSEKSSARDNPILALLTYGEGYHNYHHTFQWDYRNGVHWWHYDPTKWLIRFCNWLGLTSDLKRVSPLMIETARLEMQYRQAVEKSATLANADKWRERLEQEYEQLKQTLQLWASHRQEWYEARTSELHEKWEQLDLRDRYREARFRLKLQRQRWRELMENFSNPQQTATPGT